MPRAKSVSDEAVLDAALRVMNLHGPQALTFAAVGKEAGLSPATLVQRHGTRENLLRAALLRAWDLLDAQTQAAASAAGPGADGAVDLLLRLSASDDYDPWGPGLLLLYEDMRDPALRRRGVAWGGVLQAELGERLGGHSEEHKRLRGRLLASQWQGAMLWWGFSREGRLVDYLEGELRQWCAECLPDQ